MASSLLWRRATVASQRLTYTIQTPLALRTLSSVGRSFGAPRRDPKKLRTHAVSILEGDYEDFDEEDYEEYTEEEEDRSNMSRADRELLDEAKAQDEVYQKRKKRWLELSKPVVRVEKIDERGRSYGRGSRKSAQARVWIQPGLGEVVVNRRPFEEYFHRNWHREHILAPLVATETCGEFDIQCHVEGGGLSGKAGAIRLGLARALQNYNPEYRPPMKRLGLLTRDPRRVERKKIGKVKARKSPQWVRR